MKRPTIAHTRCACTVSLLGMAAVLTAGCGLTGVGRHAGPEPITAHKPVAGVESPMVHGVADATGDMQPPLSQPSQGAGALPAAHDVHPAHEVARLPRPEVLAAFEQPVESAETAPIAPPLPSAPPQPHSELPAPAVAPDNRAAEALPNGALAAEPLPAEVYPVDLPAALQLAGASNLQIQIAVERAREAQAQLLAAQALWLPSLNGGVSYNKHDGQIQGTEGEVIDVSRSSLFVGGGAKFLNSPLPGAGGGPRLFVDLSLADALFEPLAARQLVRAAEADEATAFNDTLLEVVLAYLELTEAQTRVAILQDTIGNFEELVDLAENFAMQGIGLQADVERTAAELAAARRQFVEAQADVQVASAELARLLRLDPAVTLLAADVQPLPLDMIHVEIPLPALIAQGLRARPEAAREAAQVAATEVLLRQEQWRPWLPNIYTGVSGGGFGGGPGSDIDNFDGRVDFDVVAAWELRSFGVGNVALQRGQASINRQARMQYQQTRDRIAAEVAQAWHLTQLRRQQIQEAQAQVEAATEALPLNFLGIRGGELRVIEAQQAINSLNSARTEYLQSIIDFNEAQFRLLRAVGQPPMPPADAAAVLAVDAEAGPGPVLDGEVLPPPPAPAPLPLESARRQVYLEPSR
ncbi:MAG: TolC family protein [Planctomycetes bacterium]|nr:TolC family protein [Planctomycetota bacterium]